MPVIIGGFIFLEGSIGFINNAYGVSNDSLHRALGNNREGMMRDVYDVLRHESGAKVAEEMLLAKLMSKMEKDGTTASLTDADMTSGGYGSSSSRKSEMVIDEDGQPKRQSKRISLQQRRSLAFKASGLKSLTGKYDESQLPAEENDLAGTNYPVRAAKPVARIDSPSARATMSIEQLTELRKNATLSYIEDDNVIESLVSLTYVHGAVIDDLLEELFTHYNDFKKFNLNFWQQSIDPQLMIILRNVADVNGDGYITSDDFRLFLIVCRLKFTPLGMGELTLKEKQEKRRNRRQEVLADAEHTEHKETWYVRMYYKCWDVRRGIYKVVREAVSSVVDMQKKYWDVIWDSIAALLGWGYCSP